MKIFNPLNTFGADSGESPLSQFQDEQSPVIPRFLSAKLESSSCCCAEADEKGTAHAGNRLLTRAALAAEAAAAFQTIPALSVPLTKALDVLRAGMRLTAGRSPINQLCSSGITR